MSHTPGPWKVWHEGLSMQICPASGPAIAEIWLRGNQKKEIADSYLLAAAPELLAALELARPWLVYRANGDDLAVVDAAIAKAKGSTAAIDEEGK
jgi:hypothetical protein